MKYFIFIFFLISKVPLAKSSELLWNKITCHDDATAVDLSLEKINLIDGIDYSGQQPKQVEMTISFKFFGSEFTLVKGLSNETSEDFSVTKRGIQRMQIESYYVAQRENLYSFNVKINHIKKKVFLKSKYKVHQVKKFKNCSFE